MKIKIDLSIQTNIIGTANVVRACKKLNIKLIYFSTNYVYPCKKGNYKRKINYFLLIIMAGQNWEGSVCSNAKRLINT